MIWCLQHIVGDCLMLFASIITSHKILLCRFRMKMRWECNNPLPLMKPQTWKKFSFSFLFIHTKIKNTQIMKYWSLESLPLFVQQILKSYVRILIASFTNSLHCQLWGKIAQAAMSKCRLRHLNRATRLPKAELRHKIKLKLLILSRKKDM